MPLTQTLAVLAASAVAAVGLFPPLAGAVVPAGPARRASAPDRHFSGRRGNRLTLKPLAAVVLTAASLALPGCGVPTLAVCGMPPLDAGAYDTTDFDEWFACATERASRRDAQAVCEESAEDRKDVPRLDAVCKARGF